MTCDKITYNTYSEAKDAIHGLVKRKRGSFKIYKCNDGNHFHVTTTRKENRLRPIKEKVHFKKEDLGKSKSYKQVVGKINPNAKTVSRPLATSKMLTPLQAQILKGKIAAMNRTQNNHHE